MAPQERAAQRVHLGQVAHLGIGAAHVQRVLLVDVVRIVGQRAVHVAAREDDDALHAVGDAVLEQALRAEDVHLVPDPRLGTEVTDEGVVHDRVRALGAEDVLHLPLPQIEDMDGDLRRVVLPWRPVDAREREGAAQPVRDQAPLAAGDAGDQDLLSGLRPGALWRGRAHDGDVLARGTAARQPSFWPVGRASHHLVNRSGRGRLPPIPVPVGVMPGWAPRLKPRPDRSPAHRTRYAIRQGASARATAPSWRRRGSAAAKCGVRS